MIVRAENRFVLVQERKHRERWYLPAGRLEAGETFADAAVREVREEAGLEVKLTGLVRMEHAARADGTRRFRAIYCAEPVSSTELKQQPDEHTIQAVWVTPAQLACYPLRSLEVHSLVDYVASGSRVYPLDVLQPEGTPLPLS